MRYYQQCEQNIQVHYQHNHIQFISHLAANFCASDLLKLYVKDNTDKFGI